MALAASVANVLPGFTEFYRVMSICLFFLGGGDFTGSERVFNEFYWVLSSFTEFYWVFNEFYWVISSFTEFYRVLAGYVDFFGFFCGFHRVRRGFSRVLLGYIKFY